MKGNFFTTNLVLKIASLLLAIALWFFVILIGRSEITMDIPLIFTNVPGKLEIVDSPKTINISIEGQQRVVKYLKQEDIKAVIDLAAAKAGRSFVTISKDNIKLPKTLLITNIKPETVSLKIETRMMKTVPVKAFVVGLPETGFAIKDINVSPKTVTVEGPVSIVEKIHSVKTEPIDINGISGNLKYKANLDIINSNVRTNTSKFEVTISVIKIK